MYHGFNKHYPTKEDVYGEDGYYDYNNFRKFERNAITSYDKKAFFARDFDEVDYFYW